MKEIVQAAENLQSQFDDLAARCSADPGGVLAEVLADDDSIGQMRNRGVLGPLLRAVGPNIVAYCLPKFHADVLRLLNQSRPSVDEGQAAVQIAGKGGAGAA